MLALELVVILMVALAAVLAVAHALELPGKLRLDKQSYLVVQTIYYPGFTYAGASEGVGVLAILALTWSTVRAARGWRSWLPR
jgi:hypothetical protein